MEGMENEPKKEQEILETNYKYLTIAFFASLAVVCTILFLWGVREDIWLILGLVAVGEVFLFVMWGLLGPKWLRKNIQAMNIWHESSSAIFFWFHPYKPILKSIEIVDNPKEKAAQIFKGIIKTILTTFLLIILLTVVWVLVNSLRN